MSARAAVAAPPAQEVKEKLKILIADSVDDDREYYRLLLGRDKTYHFEIYEAENARDALRLLREKRPDCLLMDWQLPDARGADFLRACQQAAGDGLAIVVATDRGTETLAADAMQLGAHDYIAKTAVLEGYFTQRILAAVERARLKAQVREYQIKLEQTNQALTEFTHIASHDLKAPLARITYFCELLREEGFSSLNAECQGYVGRMEANGQRLLRLIEDLLAYSRTLHVGEKREEADTGKIVAGVIDDLAPLIEKTHATVKAGALPPLPVYPMRFRQLMQNLIGNALKYKGPRDPVVSVEAADQGTHYVFSVTDNGMGIAREHLERIFKPFERLHGHDEIEGSGIGLAICQKAAALHGGKIWVESEAGRGSTFHFTVAKS
jgi:signal transduction histidine kinase